MAQDYNYNTMDDISSINSLNVQNLAVQYNISTCGSVTGRPIDIGNNKACVTDFGGCITCFNYMNGQTVWQVNITTYGFPAGYYARVGMAYAYGVLYAGTASYKSLLTPGLPGFGSWAFAISATDGSLRWKTQVSSEVYAIITQDPILESGILYYGISSGEAAGPSVPGYVCCSFVGSTVSIAAVNGRIIWSSPNIPPEISGVGQYSGAATWGGRPVIIGSYIYNVVGQLYQMPPDVAACTSANPLNASCIDPRVLFDAVIKRNKFSGEIIGSFRASAADTWNIACYLGGAIPGCQDMSTAFDYDITNLMYATQSRQLIASSKSGFVWRLDQDLNVLGAHSIAAGNAAGGYVFRAAVRDNSNAAAVGIYLAAANSPAKTIWLPSGQVTTFGAWVKYDGLLNLKWITPCPNGDRAYGSLGITNDIVYGSTRFQGLLTFMRASDGAILNTIQTAGSMTGTPYAVGNKIIWGAGPGTLLGSGLVDQSQVLILSLPN